MLTKLPKPLFFGLLGLAGALIGWIVAEPLLKVVSPAGAQTAGSPNSGSATPNLIFSNPVMQQVMSDRGAHTGEIKIGLLWPNRNDLDLHCIDPNGEEIFFGHKRARSGGELDIDCNVSAPFRNPGA